MSPVLTAAFAAGPGLRRVASTFQVARVDGGPVPELEQAGNGDDRGLTATLDFTRIRPLPHGAAYRWRVRGTPPSIGAAGWSPWCEFAIAESTPDDLGLTEGRGYRVALPAAQWREVLGVLGPVETYVNGQKSTHAPIEAAVKAASPSVSRVAVTLNGSAWSQVVNGLAWRASEDDVPAYWALADLVSAALGGPPRPTMGFPRR